MAGRNLTQLMKASATYWAQRLTLLAQAKAPKHIAPYISTSSSQPADGEVQLTLTVKPFERISEGKISNYGTTDALAQEYGHPGAVITPRTGKYLAFKWDVATVGARYAPDGNILLKKVYHKPSKAFNDGQGYIRPAAKEWEEEILASKSRFKDAIKLDVVESLDKIGANLRNIKR